MSVPASLELVQRFFGALDREDFAAARACLADDGFSFVGWFDSFTNPDDYIAALRTLRGAVVKFDLHKAFVEKDDVAFFHEIETRLGERALVAAWFHVENGRLARVRVICDPRPFAAVWGRTL